MRTSLAKWRRHRWVLAIAAIALVATACGGDDDDTTGGTDTTTGGGQTDGDTTDGETPGGGETISMLHGIKGTEEQAALQAAIDAFEQASGHTVEVEFSPQFETVIVTRTRGGDAPDVALYPQPGLLNTVVDQGNGVALADAGVDVESVSGDLVSGMVDTGTFDGTAYGVVTGINLKSLLWYAKDDFDAAGYQVPQTWEEMLTLSQTIADTGTPPWCIGIESGDATGWVATDWIEDIVLRLHGPDVYDQWVAHEVPFDSPEITAAFEELEEIWFNDDFVVGGTTGILQTPFADAAAPMFDDPPGCFLHRQAGFIEGEFPDGAQLGTDYAVAFLPPMEDGAGAGALFAGDVAAVHSTSEAAGDLVEFLVSAEGQEAWFAHAGAGKLAVRTDFDTSTYPTEALAEQGELFRNAEFARFDGSDLMPSEVGAGTFWSEMVAWISGGQDLQTTLQNIDASWPT